MKKYLVGLACFAFLAMAVPANAIMGGESAKGDDRIVHIYLDYGSTYFRNGINHKRGGCSGYLYAPRIVITAAHCLFTGPKTRVRDDKVYVGKPGSVYNDMGSHFQAERVFWYPDYTQERPKGRYDNKDFAVIVLKKAAAKVQWAKMMSRDEFFALRDQEGMVTVGGYGFSSFKERSMRFNNYKYPRKVNLPFADKDFWEQAIQCRIDCDFFGHNLEDFNDAGWVVTSKSTGTTCDGDSGAGFYIEGEQDIYVGLNAWPIGGPNCEKNGGWSEYGSMNRIDPIFYHEKLLREAINYLNRKR